MKISPLVTAVVKVTASKAAERRKYPHGPLEWPEPALGANNPDQAAAAAYEARLAAMWGPGGKMDQPGYRQDLLAAAEPRTGREPGRVALHSEGSFRLRHLPAL